MKNAIVTGGTKGIGLQIVKDLLAREYFVFLNYANDDQTAYLIEQELNKISSNFKIVKANQANMEEFDSFITLIKKKVTAVDCIICNAGETLRKSAMSITNDEWERVMQVIVNSHFYLIRELFELISSNSRIIFIGSMMGIYLHSVSLPYGVAKAAIHALAQNLVKVFQGTGTTINTIAPGFVDTEWQKSKAKDLRDRICQKTALKRFATVEEVASACMFCLENDFVNGSVLEVNGGYCFE